MCGLPKSGKSKFVDILSDFIDCYVVRPSDWYVDGDSDEFKIACWKHALDVTSDLIKNNNNDCVIILDTCGTNYTSIDSIACVAKMREHMLIVLHINTDADICSKMIDCNIVNKYVNKINDAIDYYNDNYDKVITVDYANIDEWRDEAIRIKNLICEYKLVKPSNS